jgi:SNF2 family DNA or RNA helicase
LARALANHGPVRVDGETPADQRETNLIAADVGIATIYSVTTGIDLVNFDHIIFVGLDWVPSTLQQAEARIYRIGQEKPVEIHYLNGLGTLDEAVRDRVLERLDMFASVVGSGDIELIHTLRGGDNAVLLGSLAAAILNFDGDFSGGLDLDMLVE